MQTNDSHTQTSVTSSPQAAPHVVPVHILSGFLGSGKTTLLTRALDYYKMSGRKPAVLMNELGEVNLDGMMLDADIPTTEMLGGCICCTIRGDLGMELKQLIDEHQPDVIFVESTGAANPLEMLDGVTDASLLTHVRLASVITVVDAAQFAERSVSPRSRTFRLMSDQIRCATLLLLNKTDLVPPSEWTRLEAAIRELNDTAPMLLTVRSEIDFTLFDSLEGGSVTGHRRRDEAASCSCGAHGHGTGHSQHAHDPAAVSHDPSCSYASHAGEEDAAAEQAPHVTHEHVVAYTHYFNGPIDSEQFEALIGRLPETVFRAKGVLRFTDTASTFMFQYAYRQADFIKITPKAEVPSVAVFIGEHFDKTALVRELAALDAGNAAGERPLP
ncbi:GTPase, G3E family [Paenibacillus sp. UNCCL117]|uniref:CobW family GTP-binding protein n=1 Tax=unclassified Paenibacillus TaxID=185978 RepID=UPI00088BB871|nr:MULTISPECIES: GTP-binding protein [unclassified Paenibacillus]SDC52352.1 GTPase, G3E family [Paenibacillus sp. cl123]SFW11323.1 GTPase, G3E family [Paenibacillus sp. UNCCL117]